jgi:OmpA-OmpF porin, OOP family
MYRIGTAATAALVLVASTALAQDNTEGLYVGAGFGDFSAEIDDIDDIDDAVADFDEDESAAKYFVGLRFNRFLSLQGDYYDLGDATTALKGQPVASETEAIGASIVGTLPIAFIELFARAGFITYDLEVSRGAAGNVIDESSEDAVYSAGIGFTLFQRLNLQIEYEVIDISELDESDAVWVNASWRF